MTVEKLKTAIANIEAYLSESPGDDDTVTLTTNVIRSVKENYEELIEARAEIERLKDTGLDIINQKRAEIETLKAEIKRLTKEKDKAWELFKKKCDEDIELQGLCDKRRIENEKLHVGTVEKTRALFQTMVNKFMSIKDLYVIVDGEYLPWEPAEEVQSLFGMSISGDNDEDDKETDRVVKELVGDDNG